MTLRHLQKQIYTSDASCLTRNAVLFWTEFRNSFPSFVSLLRWRLMKFSEMIRLLEHNGFRLLKEKGAVDRFVTTSSLAIRG